MTQEEGTAARLRDALEQTGLYARRLSRLLAAETGAEPESVRRSISRWLEGKPISEQYARLLASHLGKPPDYFRATPSGLKEEVAELRAKVARLEQLEQQLLDQGLVRLPPETPEASQNS